MTGRPHSWIKGALRSLVYPGPDLNTRNRASLCIFWKKGPRDVLDAGSGNGYFSWLAYRSGARVVAMNFEKGQVEKAREYLIGYKHADPNRLSFEVRNLNDLAYEVRTFDEVICYETIEHVRRHEELLTQFFRLLRPGGLLHLCAPNRDHPLHKAAALDPTESGGHVRAGYTLEEFNTLLTRVGYSIKHVTGIGPPALIRADRTLRFIGGHFGYWVTLPILPMFLPLVWLAPLNPRVPYSLYVCGEKPSTPKRN